jgi:hypothetical protein
MSQSDSRACAAALEWRRKVRSIIFGAGPSSARVIAMGSGAAQPSPRLNSGPATACLRGELSQCTPTASPRHPPQLHPRHGKVTRRRPRPGLAAVGPRLPQHVALLPLLHRRVRPTPLRQHREANSSSLNIPSDDADVARANAVVDRMAAALEGCPTRTYFVVRQNGVSSADFSDAHRSAPRLASHLSGESDYVKSTLVVPEVIEENFTAAGISKYLQSKCGAQVLSEDATAPDSDKQRVVEVTFTAPPADMDFRSTELEQRGKHMRRNGTGLQTDVA